MTVKLSIASIFQTRYLANHSANPLETFSVLPYFGEVSLEDKSNRHSHSKYSSQITMWTQFYSSITMVAPSLSHIVF